MTRTPPSLHVVASESSTEGAPDLPERHRKPRAAHGASRLSPVARIARPTAPAETPTPLADDDEAPYRVLVVEDDPSQALFAESVLQGAGIQTHGVRISTEVMPAMDAFQPDLVLMDLHMPALSGAQLTSLIRAHPAFTHVPIVFLTGDQDPERQFEALELGADDFLSKPIRPRHLMAAVQSRIKRARTLTRQRRRDTDATDSRTGLHHRPQLLRAIASALADGTGGGALFAEIRHTGLLRERYGYAGFEQLLQAAGKRVAELAAPCPSARLGDGAFLVFAPASVALPALACTLRDGIRHSEFEHDGMLQRLDIATGYALLDDFAEASSLLDALGKAAHAARSEPTGIVAHVVKPVGAQALIPVLRTALSDGGLELSFQPLVAVAGGEHAQFQVLLRLREADGTVHPAGALIPAAESAGLMPEIDRWVLEQAIDRLPAPTPDQHPVRLFVSQSPRTLALETHARWVLDLLERRGIPADWLTVDLRLDDALLHAATMRGFIDPLHRAGVRFCLNQYADGAEPDALLDQLPLEYLRLSPRYSGAHSEPATREELRRVIDRAHALGLQVIGPQVENAQGAAMLWMSGIDLIQGNLVQQANEALDFDFQHAML